MIEYMTGALQNLEGNGLLLPAVILCVILSLLTLWFLTRNLRLWYWKVNAHVSALQSIDEKLKILGEGISASPVGLCGSEEPAESPTEEVEAETPGESEAEKAYTEEELELLIKD